MALSMTTAKVSANDALAGAYDDHEWTPAVLDTNTTEGIKNTLKAHAAAIQALANHIDGVKPDVPVDPKVAVRR